MNRPYLVLQDGPTAEWASNPQRGCAPGRVDPEIFFPGSKTETANEPALQACRWCPVKEQCREFALAHPGLFGVWGGLTQNERDRLHRIS